MALFPVEEFFSLNGFSHRLLWSREGEVWEGLINLKGYVDQLRHRIEIEVANGVVLKGAVSIGEGSLIEAGAYIEGPCVIGKNCTIRNGAYLRPYSVLGDGCVVGHSSEIKHSVLLNGAAATHFVYVGDSILGGGVNLGAGVKCANLRLDRGEVKVVRGEAKVGTGLKKLGAIVGDGTQVGCNCVLNPGTVLGRDSACYPLLNVGGFIPARSVVRGSGQVEIELRADPKEILEKMGRRA